jgi:hypothetical protein
MASGTEGQASPISSSNACGEVALPHVRSKGGEAGAAGGSEAEEGWRGIPIACPNRQLVD